MALQASTGLRTAMLGSSGLSEQLNLGFINIYSGAPPATADAAVTGTLLCTISNNATATGLTFDAAAAGTLPKKASEVWKGVNAASGTAGYFRFVAVGDTGVLSTTQARLQGTIATAGADLNLSSVNLTSGADQTIDAANFTLPTY
jgi:hypothetical protein